MIKLTHYWKLDARRHIFWLPAVFAMGIAIYFALPDEPSLWLVGALNVGALVALVMLWRHKLFRTICGLLLAVTLAMLWSSYQTQSVQLVVVSEAMKPQMVRGVIRNIERTPDGYRLTLSDVSMAQLAPEETPARIRISMRPKRGEFTELPPIGTPVELMAGLLPPMGPALPGGFDFGRFFYFNGIGAVGFGLPPLHVLEKPPATHTFERIRDDFWSWRSNLTDAILRDWGQDRGPIIAGFITGDIRALPEADFNILRASNLYHIVAISGEHMMVISGVVFLLLRWFTLMLPGGLRYRPQMKTVAAVLTLIIVSVYVFVTGLPVSAIRAYLMIALVLISIIIGRQTQPMRSLFIAALIMLVLTPADLFDPGFQLSFSATIALIALIEYRNRNLIRSEMPRWQQWRVHLGTVLLASLVAELATTPFVLSQFNTISIYGIAANTVATPLVSFFLMPLVALFFLMLPLGLTHWVLWLMDRGIAALMWIANTTGNWPHALLAFPSPPEWAVAMFALGLLWLCIWQARWRYWALPFMAVALVSPLFVRPPDVLIGAQLKQIAFRSDHGYLLARGRTTSLLPKIWANGVGEVAFETPAEDDAAWRCDPLGCVANVRGGHRVAFLQNAVAAQDDCALADLLVTMSNGIICPDKTVIDGDALARGGIHAVWFEKDGMRIKAASSWQKHRPWSAMASE